MIHSPGVLPAPVCLSLTCMGFISWDNLQNSPFHALSPQLLAFQSLWRGFPQFAPHCPECTSVHSVHQRGAVSATASPHTGTPHITLWPGLSIPAVAGIPDFLKGSSWHCCIASWQLESSSASQSHLAAGGESGWNVDEPICPSWCVERWRGWRWTLGSVTALE